MGSNKTKATGTGRRRANAKRVGRDGQGRENWRLLLAGASPREVLARLMKGDPLELRRSVGERMRSRAFLLDANLVHLRAVARCARFAVRYRGQPGIDRWLSEIVDEAMLDLVTEEQEWTRAGDRPGREDRESGVFRELSLPLILDPASTRRACAAFNELPEDERLVFFALVIDNQSLDQVARERAASATAVARQARGALEALLGAARDLEQKSPRRRQAKS